jgi:hypothetical protein
VYLSTYTGIEIHALLHYEERQLDSLLEPNELDERIERLIEFVINPDAIRFVYGIQPSGCNLTQIARNWRTQGDTSFRLLKGDLEATYSHLIAWRSQLAFH